MFRHWMIVGLAFICLGSARAQGSYFGIGGSVLTNFADGVVPLLGLHVGGPVTETLELRGSLDTLLFISNLGADLLYPFKVSPTLKGYAGGGADFVYIFIPGLAAGSTFALHATAGLEARTGTLGFYGEVQPYVLLSAPIRAVKARLGVNVHF